ncbi:LysR family transcriptional regulator [Bacterioplanes sanyensis]|uniref:LysR family transcriptional regulator n=1 Tax=Bacterioplanes sanyensis TaxID=1249553 RepID=A0A222FIY6_9GAMM|nr:LysR family transcriptional regulator [Bacterioplanes sanyensis]ASP38381.1 LysR family transcriptional regulator [Bacterioplanes sanyensis]
MPLSVQKLVSRLTLRQLQVFKAVYEQGGYGKAAALLGLTQPAVSAQIRQLEQALDHTLFEYVGRKLYCTPAGEVVATNIAAMFAQLKDMQSDLHALKGQLAGDLCIAAVSTAQYVVPHLLQLFLQQFPAIQARIDVVNRQQALERLADNRDDLVIMGLVPTERPLTSLPFLDNQLVAVAPAQHKLAAATSVSLEQFLHYPLLLREPGSGTRLALEQHCQQRRVTLQAVMELGSNDAVKHAVMAGMGVAVLPKMGILAELRLGLLQEVAVADFPLRRSWCLVYPKAKQPSPISRAFIDFVQSQLASIDRYFATLEAPPA